MEAYDESIEHPVSTAVQHLYIPTTPNPLFLFFFFKHFTKKKTQKKIGLRGFYMVPINSNIYVNPFQELPEADFLKPGNNDNNKHNNIN